MRPMAPLTLEDYKAQLKPIPAGSFKREGFTITLAAFQMGRTPVTVGMWQEYAAAMGLKMPKLPNYPVWNDGWDSVRDHPIVRVRWDDCKDYADWAGLLLPTEAQWEYAARGGLIGKAFPWGNDEPNDQLWWTPTSGDKGTAPVDRSNNVFVNGYGLCDVYGNVWEWCADRYGDYAKRNETDPTGAKKGDYRVLRGGSWFRDIAGGFRSALRFGYWPSSRDSFTGFRLSSPGPR
jgi:formylglycine-generating enzyme required for sulfatase activity